MLTGKITTLLVCAALACGKGATSPNAASPERQSEAEYDLARDYFGKGEIRSALDHALKAVELDDQNAKALYFVSAIYLSFCATVDGLKSADCRLADAESFARRAMATDAQFRDARNLLGQVLILGGKYKDAIDVLQPLTQDPAYAQSHLAWGNLGWAQVLNGSVDEGIASLKNAVTQPKFCVGFYRLGVAYEKKGDWAQAETNLTQAIQVDSKECQELQDAWQERANVRLKLNKLSDACSDLGRCRGISTESAAGKACAQLMVKSSCPTG